MGYVWNSASGDCLCENGILFKAKHSLSTLWDIATSRTSIFNVVVSDSGIIAFNSKYGILNMNTAEVEDLLAGQSEADAVLEIQLETNGTKTTVTQEPVLILNDLIDDASYTVTQWGDLIPADAVVRYDTAQTLSPAEQAQAKANIGVSDIDTTALTNKDIELEGRIGDLEGLSLSQAQLDAINGSELPSSTNPVITDSALNTELAQKANVIHTHTISDVTDLQNQLNQKVGPSHTHNISDINGLTTTLQNKAETSALDALVGNYAGINHTHTSFTTLGVTTLVSDEVNATNVNATQVDSDSVVTKGIVVNDGSTEPIFGSLDTVQRIGMALDPILYPPPVNVQYPYEIPIKINGVIYLVPAREYIP